MKHFWKRMLAALLEALRQVDESGDGTTASRTLGLPFKMSICSAFRKRRTPAP